MILEIFICLAYFALLYFVGHPSDRVIRRCIELQTYPMFVLDGMMAERPNAQSWKG